MASLSLNLSSHISFSQSISLRTPFLSPGFSLSTTTSSINSPAPAPSVYCGRGDRKTAKGKRFNHSFGNSRPRDKKKGRGPPRIPVPASPNTKIGPFDDDGQVVKIEIEETPFSD